MSAADWKCQDSRSLMQTRRLGLSIVGAVASVVGSVVDSVVDSGLKVRGAGTTEWELNAQHPFPGSKCK